MLLSNASENYEILTHYVAVIMLSLTLMINYCFVNFHYYYHYANFKTVYKITYYSNWTT